MAPTVTQRYPGGRLAGAPYACCMVGESRRGQSFGAAVALYSAQRVVLFALSTLAVAAVGLRGLPLLAVALLASSLVSLVVLRGQRDAFTARLAERSAARSEERQRLQDRLREE